MSVLNPFSREAQSRGNTRGLAGRGVMGPWQWQQESVEMRHWRQEARASRGEVLDVSDWTPEEVLPVARCLRVYLGEGDFAAAARGFGFSGASVKVLVNSLERRAA